MKLSCCDCKDVHNEQQRVVLHSIMHELLSAHVHVFHGIALHEA